mgnify:CR=1 FL=1
MALASHPHTAKAGAQPVLVAFCSCGGVVLRVMEIPLWLSLARLVLVVVLIIGAGLVLAAIFIFIKWIAADEL